MQLVTKPPSPEYTHGENKCLMVIHIGDRFVTFPLIIFAAGRTSRHTFPLPSPLERERIDGQAHAAPFLRCFSEKGRKRNVAHPDEPRNAVPAI